MRLITAIVLGAILAFVLPLVFGGRSGVWMESWAAWGTIRPHKGSPSLLFSIPVFLGATFIFRAFFNWHNK